MVTTTTAIQVDVTPELLKESLWSLIGLHTSGKLIFLPVVGDEIIQEDNRYSEEWVPAEAILSYIKSLDG